MPGENKGLSCGLCCVYATENGEREDHAPHFLPGFATKKLNTLNCWSTLTRNITVGTPAFRRAFVKISAFEPRPVVDRNAPPALRRARE